MIDLFRPIAGHAPKKREANEILAKLGFSDQRANEILQSLNSTFGDRHFTDLPRADPYFLANLKMLASRKAAVFSAVADLGDEFDFLANDLKDYSLTKALNLSAMNTVRAKKDCVAVLTARNEGPFLLEWIAFHKAVGFDAIVVYTNDNDDGSTELLQLLAANNEISLFRNVLGGGTSAQIKAYEHSHLLNIHLRDYKWHMYLDADEFLLIDSKYNYNIGNLLRAAEQMDDSIASISFNWFWMASHGARRYQPEPLTERFTYGADHSFVRSIFRASDALSICQIHKPILKPHVIAVNSAFQPISLEGHEAQFECSGGRINHYWCKSFQEFLVKQARGDAGFLKRATTLFFDWDVPPSREMLSPIPAELKTRVDIKKRELVAVPEIRDADARVQARYLDHCSSLCSPEALDALYAKIRIRSRMLNSLNKYDGGKSEWIWY